MVIEGAWMTPYQEGGESTRILQKSTRFVEDRLSVSVI